MESKSEEIKDRTYRLRKIKYLDSRPDLPKLWGGWAYFIFYFYTLNNFTMFFLFSLLYSFPIENGINISAQ